MKTIREISRARTQVEPCSKDKIICQKTPLLPIAPGFGDRRKAVLQDIAVLTSSEVISGELGVKLGSVTLKMLGKAKRVLITTEATAVIDGSGKKRASKPASDRSIHRLKIRHPTTTRKSCRSVKGIIDPAKVVRIALQAAASIGCLMVATEAGVADVQPDSDAGAGHDHGVGMGAV